MSEKKKYELKIGTLIFVEVVNFRDVEGASEKRELKEEKILLEIIEL